jgi:hypothetical protein
MGCLALELCSPMSDGEHNGGGRQGCCRNEHAEQGHSEDKQAMVSSMHMCSVVCLLELRGCSGGGAWTNSVNMHFAWVIDPSHPHAFDLQWCICCMPAALVRT